MEREWFSGKHLGTTYMDSTTRDIEVMGISRPQRADVLVMYLSQMLAWSVVGARFHRSNCQNRQMREVCYGQQTA